MSENSKISSVDFDIIKNDLKKGTLKLPQFQRELVWPLKKSAALLDSILRGYPIGSIILWKTTERFDDIRNIGEIDSFPPAPKDIQIDYIIDGQQRITSLYAILEGIITKKGNKKTDYKEVYVDLDIDPEAKGDEKIVVSKKETGIIEDSERYIKLHKLLESKFSVLEKYSEDRREKIQKYRDRIKMFSLPKIELPLNADIEVVVEVFTRLNTGGKPLGIFEIMVAKTYVKNEFDLSKKYKELQKYIDTKIKDWKIPFSTVLQIISIFLGNDNEPKKCSKKAILLLDKDDFINTWDDAVRYIKTTIDFFKSHYRIPSSKLLPYDGLMVVFAYYFFKKGKGITAPTGKDADYLKELFWRVSIAERYKEGLESKISQDVRRVDEIMNGDRPDYDWLVNTNPDRIKTDGAFSTGRSFIKTILAVYAAQRPKDFKSSGDVALDKSNLDKKNSKNYHHFFPKKFLKENKVSNPPADHILNITMITDRTNKSDINEDAPSIYLPKLKKGNPKLTKQLSNNHLIDVDRGEVLKDNYDKFFNNRAERVSEELKKLIGENKD